MPQGMTERENTLSALALLGHLPHRGEARVLRSSQSYLSLDKFLPIRYNTPNFIGQFINHPVGKQNSEA